MDQWRLQDKRWMPHGCCRILVSTGGKEPFCLHSGKDFSFAERVLEGEQRLTMTALRIKGAATHQCDVCAAV